MTRSALLMAALFIVACGDEAGPGVGIEDGPLADAVGGDTTGDSGTGTAADTVEADILYTGYLCDEDEACATGLCYGTATNQGFFEPAKCQVRCLDPFDYKHYCDSDDDCCRGRCCLDCGPQEGLCVIQ